MNKPQAGLSWLQATINANKKSFKPTDKFCLIGVRGYFLDSMGAKGKNDRGIYDDAFFWVELETGRFHQFNGNVDPSRIRKGAGFGSKKGMAVLAPGFWRYKTGMHYGSVAHAAFRQAADVTVIRDGYPEYADTGMFGINIHKGGVTGTSSLGCQTVPVDQWDDFRNTGYALVKKFAAKDFPYILIEAQGPTAVITTSSVYGSWPNQEWAKHVEKCVQEIGLDKLPMKDAKDFFPSGVTVRNMVHLMGAMCKYESNFKPATTYKENFKSSASGDYVISTGLFQVSYGSLRGYGIKTTTEALKEPYHNIECAVKVLHKLIKDNGSIAGKLGGKWQGGARYWSVLRAPAIDAKTKVTLKKWAE